MAASNSTAPRGGTDDASPFVAGGSLRSAQNSPQKRRDHLTDADGQELDLGPAAIDDEDDIAELESSIIRQSRTIEDFTRIIAEWRSERERSSAADGGGAQSIYGAASIVQNGEGSSLSPQRRLRVRSSVASLSADAAARMPHDNDVASIYSYEASSMGDPDDGRMSPTLSPLGMPDDAGSRAAVRVRCTCCCGRGTRRCKRARRATREWSQMESDLHLAAQIGQALLRRSDALHAELSQAQEQHGGRINSMMKKLTSSIKETGQLAKRLEQSELNMEACEASNRALMRELDEARRELSKAKGSTARTSTLEARLERAEREVEDLRQELSHEQKSTEQIKTRAKRAEKLTEDLQSDLRLAKMQSQRVETTDGERTLRKEEVRKLVEKRMRENGMAARPAEEESGEDAQWVESLVAENDGLVQENKQMKELLDARNDELTQLREELSQRSDSRPLLVNELARRGETGHADAPLRLADVHLSTPQTPLSDEIVDVTTIVSSPSLQTSVSVEPTPTTPGLLSPYTPNSSLPSTTAMSSSIETVTEATSDAALCARPVEMSTSAQGTPTLTTTATFASLKRETRTAQLVLLIDMIARLFTRLSTADVDTMAKRLQRQKLTGDVGHLARTTVNGILRDVDGLRDHFRRSMDSEAKGRDTDNASLHSRQSSKSGGGGGAATGSGGSDSESLVARKELFALIKVFKDIFLEMARLRNAVNEVSLQPQHASRILQEQLGVQVLEDKGVGAWFGRLLSTTGLPGTTTSTGGSGVTANGTSSTGSAAAAGLAALSVGQGAGGGAKPSGSRTLSGSQLGAPRAAAAATSSAVAVEVKGMHAFESGGGGGGGDGGSSIHSASPQPDQGSFDASAVDGRPSFARPAVARRQPSLSRVQSRNLSGLFVGSMAGGGGGTDGPSPNGLSPNNTGGGGAAAFLATRNRISSDQSTGTQGSRLSRIVDDDELSIHHTSRARTLRPRNLSDSSMHTTYLDDGDQVDDGFEVRPSGNAAVRPPRLPSGLMAAAAPTPAAISRIVTPSTLSLQASRDGQTSATATKSASSGGGLLSSFAPTRSVAKAAFSLLSPSLAGGAATSATSPTGLSPTVPGGLAPKLRSKSSQAQLALAAATGSGAGSGAET